MLSELLKPWEGSVDYDVDVHRRAGLGVEHRGERTSHQVRERCIVQRTNDRRYELGETAHYSSAVAARRAAPAALICAATSDISIAI